MLVHRLTQQCKRLDGKWKIVFDEDGEVAVLQREVPGQASVVADIDLHLNFVLCLREGSSEVMWMDMSEGIKSMRPFDELRTPFKGGTATVKESRGASSYDICVFVFKMPRDCQVPGF